MLFASPKLPDLIFFRCTLHLFKNRSSGSDDFHHRVKTPKKHKFFFIITKNDKFVKPFCTKYNNIAKI